MTNRFTLYYSPFACSFAIHAALDKLGVTVALVKVDIYKHEHLTPEFKTLNPQAQVPVLKHAINNQEDIIITQASAILLYLSELYPDAMLMPELGSKERAKSLETLFYLSNTLHPYFLRLFYPDRLSNESPDNVKDLGIQKIHEALKDIDEQLSKQMYCTCDTLYAPDYYLFAMLNWLRIHPVDISEMDNLKAYIKRMKSHSEIQAVLGKEMQNLAA